MNDLLKRLNEQLDTASINRMVAAAGVQFCVDGVWYTYTEDGMMRNAAGGKVDFTPDKVVSIKVPELDADDEDEDFDY